MGTPLKLSDIFITKISNTYSIYIEYSYCRSSCSYIKYIFRHVTISKRKKEKAILIGVEKVEEVKIEVNRRTVAKGSSASHQRRKNCET